MKVIKRVKVVFVLMMLFGILSSCNKDEESNTGQLNLYFHNYSSDIEVILYSMEDTSIPIDVMLLNQDREKKENLLIGNYYVKVDSKKYYSSIGFQIKPDQTTTISWGVDNDARQN